MVLEKQEVALFRYRKGVRVGYCIDRTADKVRLAIGRDRSVTVPRENVLFRSGEKVVDHAEFAQFAREVDELAARLDLSEVWELTGDDRTGISFDDLASLVDLVDGRGRTALLLHLHGEDCMYFASEGELWVPATADSVQKVKEKVERQRAEAEELTAFTAWFCHDKPSEPLEMTARQRTWLESLRRFVIAGEEAERDGWVRGFLAQFKRSDPRRFVFERLVHLGQFAPDEHLELSRLGVKSHFADEVTVAAAEPIVISDNDDGLVEVPVFSIDSETTFDIDDALSFESTTSGWRLGIHVTDLTDVVTKDGVLDAAARERRLSLYFPEAILPMLPTSLSSGSASLLPEAERRALSLYVEFDSEHKPLAAEFRRTRVRNDFRLNYDEVDLILRGERHLLAEQLRALWQVVVSLRGRRIAAGGVALERPDPDVQVGADGAIRVDLKDRDTPANRLVSECMILYNHEAARYLVRHAVPGIFRSQQSKVATDPAVELKDPFSRYSFFRQLGPSHTSLEALPHNLLGLDCYVQSTSPLRRYGDLVIQRQLVRHLQTGTLCYSAEELADLLRRGESVLKELGRLEVKRKRYWLIKWLAQQGELEIAACVLEVRPRDCLVELIDYGLRGPALVHQPHEGDHVTVSVAHADAWDDAVRFRQVR